MLTVSTSTLECPMLAVGHIEKREAQALIVEHHYLHRRTGISHAIGLYDDRALQLQRISVLERDLALARRELAALKTAARPFGEMAQEMLTGHVTGRLPKGAPERLLAALAVSPADTTEGT